MQDGEAGGFVGVGGERVGRVGIVATVFVDGGEGEGAEGLGGVTVITRDVSLCEVVHLSGLFSYLDCSEPERRSGSEGSCRLSLPYSWASFAEDVGISSSTSIGSDMEA